VEKVCIIYNEDKDEAKNLYKESLNFFRKKGIEILNLEEIEQCTLAVVIGGDGTLLRASKKLLKNQDLNVIAINAGNLGFLTEIKKEDAFETYQRYLNGNYEIEERRYLEVKIREKNLNVLNELVISKGGVRTKMLKIDVNSKDDYINTYRADGVIFSTPTGSTAYSLSAGGPIIVPSLKALVITPIAPHNLTARPIVIDGKEELNIKIREENRMGYLIIDGETCYKIDSKDTITLKYSPLKLKLVLPIERNYYNVLREKLKWGDNLC
jgi:NAD+ kinase